MGIGCGLMTALALIPVVVIGLILVAIFGSPFGWTSKDKAKDGVKVTVSQSDSLTGKLAEVWTDYEKKNAARLRSVEGLQLYGFEQKPGENSRYDGGLHEWKQLHTREDCPSYQATSKAYAARLFVVRRGRFIDANDFFHDERQLCERCIP
jgi:hypothetical protein